MTLLVAFISCKGDTAQKDTQASQLVGKWEMKEAYKAGQNTKLLSNGFFEFDSIGQLKSNVLAISEFTPFTLNSNTIEVANSKKSMLNVEVSTLDSLILSTKIRNIEFQFILLKSK